MKRLLFSPSFLHTFKRVSGKHGLHFPLKFPSVLSELNFLSVLCLLNFASGYRVPLHEQTGRGAWDNIRALVFGMYLSSTTGEDDLLSAKGMRTTTPQKIAELMSVKIYSERSHETLPGVTVGELGGRVYDLVKLISTTLNETGEILQRSGLPDLGSFVLRSLTSKHSGGDVTVDDVLKDVGPPHTSHWMSQGRQHFAARLCYPCVSRHGSCGRKTSVFQSQHVDINGAQCQSSGDSRILFQEGTIPHPRGDSALWVLFPTTVLAAGHHKSASIYR